MAVPVGVFVALAVVGALKRAPLDVARRPGVLSSLTDAHTTLAVAVMTVDTLLARSVKRLRRDGLHRGG